VRATIPQTTVQRIGITTIAVGQVAVGPIQIGRLEVSDFHLGLTSSKVFLENFRITLTLRLSLDWEVRIHIPFDGTPSWNGTIDLGSPSVTIPLHDVTIPGLQNLTIDVDSLAAGPITAKADPITNLTLGSAVAEQLRAQQAVLPAQGFSIAGLGLTAIRADGVTVPAAVVDVVDIARVHGEALPFAGITLANLALPAGAVQDIQSQGIDTAATGVTHGIHADVGVLEITLNVTPEARGQIDRLAIAGITASSTIGSIQLRNVVAPYELLNLRLSDLGIDQIAIPALGVS
jgi:hypothetical protein